MRFTDLEQLKCYLINEAQKASLCPVRFINVETMEAWIQVKAFLSTLTNRTLLLSRFCEERDTAPNLNRLKHTIRTSDKSTMVIPLSEYLRINNHITRKTIDDILNANYERNISGKLRIYVPVYRMKEVLENISLNPRQQDCIAFFETGSDSDYSLTIVQEDLQLSLQGNQTHGYQEYLMYWEQNPNKPVIFHTKNAIHYTDIVFVDDVTVIITAYDLLRHHYHMPADIKEDLGTEFEWLELSKAYGQAGNLENAICQLLPAYQFSDELYEGWSEYSPFKRWLLWLWTKSKQSTGYLGHVIDKSFNVKDFVDLIQIEIINSINSDNYTQMARERKKLIKGMKLKPSQTFLDQVSTLEPLEQIMCLTDVTQQEKQMILSAFSENGSTDAAIQALREVYPDAYNYLDDIGFSENKLDSYFLRYRLLKVTNKVDDALFEEVNTNAKNNLELIWKLEARNSLMDKLYSKQTEILFVDALGVEYLSLLQHLFDEGNYEVKTFFGRCNLPSTTEYNTDFLVNRRNEKFYKLDELKHSAINYPENILAEFDLLHEVKTKVDEIIQKGFTVIITADHGTSRMAVLYRSQAPVYQCKEHAQLEKYGRYCVDTQNDYSDIEGCFPYNQYWIFSNYSRFAEKGAPHCEIHGGASLEEMIVPVIMVSKKETLSYHRTDERITVLTTTVNVGASKEATIKFRLTKEYAAVIAVIANQRIPCEYSSGEYSFRFRVNSSGQFTANIIAGGLALGDFTFKVIKGIAKSDLDI
jgi:hypothetical protein